MIALNRRKRIIGAAVTSASMSRDNIRLTALPLGGLNTGQITCDFDVGGKSVAQCDRCVN